MSVIIDHLVLSLNAKEHFLFVDDEDMVPVLVQANVIFKLKIKDNIVLYWKPSRNFKTKLWTN